MSEVPLYPLEAFMSLRYCLLWIVPHIGYSRDHFEFRCVGYWDAPWTCTSLSSVLCSRVQSCTAVTILCSDFTTLHKFDTYSGAGWECGGAALSLSRPPSLSPSLPPSLPPSPPGRGLSRQDPPTYPLAGFKTEVINGGFGDSA